MRRWIAPTLLIAAGLAYLIWPSKKLPEIATHSPVNDRKESSRIFQQCVIEKKNRNGKDSAQVT